MRLLGIVKVFIILLAVIWAGCKHKNSQPSFSHKSYQWVHYHQLEWRQGESQAYYKSEPYTGISTQHHPNGQLAESITYVSGKKEGSHQKWYEDGTRSYVAQYQTNKLHGTCKTWWTNGQLRSVSNYHEGRAHGTRKQR